MVLPGGPLEDKSQGLHPHKQDWCLRKGLNVINLSPFCIPVCGGTRRPSPDTKCWHPDLGIPKVRNNVVYKCPSLKYLTMLTHLSA